ncbi:single-stranded DNA-binding protein [Candidatus Giovannonibacteria bacterium]|nr:single-stranded DNA-binding protein [Candidatus Giovannonibacteria bacterium]
MNLNKVFLIGNLTRDPELRSLPSGQPVVNFGIATNRMWKGKDGAQQKQTEFHNIVMFGRLAEIAHQYLKKGAMVMVEGRIQTRSWEKDGQKRNKTEIVAEGMQMGPRNSTGYSGNPSTRDEKIPTPQEPEEIATVEYPEDEINPDNIPF